MRKNIILFIGLATGMAVITLLVTLASCGGTGNAYSSITFDLAPGYESSKGNFDEEGSTVLRCNSFVENEHGITVTTSKSKDLKANTLVFIKASNADSSGTIWIASAPIIGKEYEYDMTQARFYPVTASSAKAASQQYGIPYLDWQTGATNNSGKFPCCE